MALEAGEQQGDLPVVTTSPRGMALPAVGDRIESVNGQKLVGSPDPYSRAVELIASSGPLTQGFISKSVASGAQPKAVSALGSLGVAAACRPAFQATHYLDVLTAVNGAELSKCALTVSQLALLLKALPRPLKLSFMESSPSLK